MIFSGMTMKLDGTIIYTSNSAIADNQNISVVFPDTLVGKDFEIIGISENLLGFKDSLKCFQS